MCAVCNILCSVGGAIRSGPVSAPAILPQPVELVVMSAPDALFHFFSLRLSVQD